MENAVVGLISEMIDQGIICNKQDYFNAQQLIAWACSHAGAESYRDTAVGSITALLKAQKIMGTPMVFQALLEACRQLEQMDLILRSRGQYIDHLCKNHNKKREDIEFAEVWDMHKTEFPDCTWEGK